MVGFMVWFMARVVVMVTKLWPPVTKEALLNNPCDFVSDIYNIYIVGYSFDSMILLTERSCYNVE